MKSSADARTSAGQRIEDELDAISEETCRRARDWITKLGRGQSEAAKRAALGGIATAVIENILILTGGDLDQTRAAWDEVCAGFFVALAEDKEPQE